jgi:hypothetical protein
MVYSTSSSGISQLDEDFPLSDQSQNGAEGPHVIIHPSIAMTSAGLSISGSLSRER